MDKRIIFAVAGAGKTATIINSLSLDNKSLIITYTDNNYKNLEFRIINRFGYLPENIKIYTYFTFLYSFCYKPFLSDRVKAKGINWDTPPAFTMRKKRNDPLFYIDRNKNLYHNRIAKLLLQMELQDGINNRLEKYYDNLFIDEIQDFGGHDFNLLKSIVLANIDITFVGDFYQHTFDTSKDGVINKNIYNDYEKYKILFTQMGLTIDTGTLINSYRCNTSICAFVSSKLNIHIESNSLNTSNIEYVEDEDKVNEIFKDDNIVKLFYQNSIKYNCHSNNWGKSKGQDHYRNVCIVLNPTTLSKYLNDELIELNPQTKNKLYVACTRARENIYFVKESMCKKFKYLDLTI